MNYDWNDPNARNEVLRLLEAMRRPIAGHLEKRGLVLSHRQLLVYLLYAPTAVAIASDGAIDRFEDKLLHSLRDAIDFFPDLPEEFELLPQPADAMDDGEFRRRFPKELEALVLEMAHIEEPLVESLRQLLQFAAYMGEEEENPQELLLTNIQKIMTYVIKNNFGDDDVEYAKMKRLLARLRE